MFTKVNKMLMKDGRFTGVSLSFCDLYSFSKDSLDTWTLKHLVHSGQIKFPSPFIYFSDSLDDYYVVALIDNSNHLDQWRNSPKALCGFTQAELAEMLFKALREKYLDLEAYRARHELICLSEAQFKEIFIRKISEYFRYMEVYDEDDGLNTETFNCWN